MYKKVLLSFSVTLIFLVLLGVASIVKMLELADLSENLYEHPYTVTAATKTLETNVVSMHRYMKDVALAKNTQELLKAIENVNKNELVVYRQFDIIFDKYLGDRQDIQKSYDAFVKWKPIRDEVISLVQIELSQKVHIPQIEEELSNRDKATVITKGKGAEHIKNLNTQVNKLINYASNKAMFFNENALLVKKNSIIIIGSLLVVIIVIILTILILLIKNIKHTEKETKKYFHLIDQNIMSATMDSSLKINEVSNALARHIGYSKEDILNKSNGFLYEDSTVDKQNTIKRIIQSGDDWIGEIKKKDSSGEIKWLESNIHPLFNEDYKVIGYTNILHDISSKKEIEEISKVDGLTSLYNRRYFDEMFPNQIKIVKRNSTLLAFLMIDIDHFKQYNDTYGHQAGDTTLKKVALALSKTLKRPDDFTFRLGGEEFGLLYHTTCEDDAIFIANTVRENVENLKIEHSGNSASSYVTISSGLYIIEVDDINTTDEIYNKTDEALYVAKSSGRNQVSISQ